MLQLIAAELALGIAVLIYFGRKVMSLADQINVSVARNTKATADAVAALASNATTSTPDSVVLAALNQVDANSAELEKAVAPPAPAPA